MSQDYNPAGDRKVKFTWGVGGLSAAFVLGAVFWAGASYNRLQGMEKALVEIQGTMNSFVASQQNAQLEVKQHSRDIEQLRKEVDRLLEAQRGTYTR